MHHYFFMLLGQTSVGHNFNVLTLVGVPLDKLGRRDTQHNDIQHNGLTCDTQHNDIQHNGLTCDTQHK